MRYAKIKQSLLFFVRGEVRDDDLKRGKECSKHAVNVVDYLLQARKIAPTAASQLSAPIPSKTFPRTHIPHTPRGTRAQVTPTLHPTHNTLLRGHTAPRQSHRLHSRQLIANQLLERHHNPMGARRNRPTARLRSPIVRHHGHLLGHLRSHLEARRSRPSWRLPSRPSSEGLQGHSSV